MIRPGRHCVRRVKSLAAAMVAAATTLGLAACGDDDLAALAELVPASAVFYVEGTIKPEGEQAAAIEAIAARFPGGGNLGQTIESAIDQSIAEETERGDPLTFREDIEPWLGERAALFVEDIAEFEQEASPPLIVQVTDPDAAQSTLERSAEADEAGETEEEHEGVSYLVDEEGQAAGIVDGNLVIAGEEEGFIRVVDVARGDEPNLEQLDSFTYDVGDSDGQGSLVFTYLDVGTMVEQAIAADPSPELTSEQARELAAQAGLDLEEPWLVGLEAESDAATLTLSLPVTGDGEESEQAPDLLAELPADSLFAARCDFCADALVAGLRLGVEATSEGDPEDTIGQVEAAFGVEFEELEAALGSSALFLRGSQAADMEGALTVELLDPETAEQAVEAARSALGESPPARTTIEELPQIPGSPTGFSVETAELPNPLLVALDEERLITAIGEQAARDAFVPGETLATSGAIAELEEQTGGGLEPVVYGDLGGLVDLIAAFAGDDPEFARAAPYLRPLGLLLAGTQRDGDRRIASFVVTFD